MSTIELSFEFFPPKSAEGIKKLRETATSLASLNPHFFTVTYGAGGSTRDNTLSAVNLLQELAIPVAPHLSCIGATLAEITASLEQYKALGINRILALRGDLLSGMTSDGDFKFASDLIKLIRSATTNHFHIVVAAYPEFHPQAQNATNDILNLKRKVEVGANSAITQYFYNPDAYFYFQDQCAKFGISIPIVPGIMPITQFSKLANFSDRCGAEIPRWMRKRFEAFGDDADSIKSFGEEIIFNLCQKLLSGGAPGLHFYTLNHAEPSLQLLKLLNLTSKQQTSSVS